MGFLDDLFGTDEKTKYDDGNYWGPIHATDEGGNDVTVSFGKSVDEGASTDRSGETLICDGHVDASTFYERDDYGHSIGHDHFMSDGSPAGNYGDRGAYTGDRDS